MKRNLVKSLVTLLGFLLITIVLNSCSITNKVIVRDYSEKMELLKINFPEIYNLYVEGKVIINEIYTYNDKKTGEPRVNVNYRHVQNY